MFITFLRIIKFAFQNFFRNFWLSIITVTMLVLTLFTVNILVGLQFLGGAAVHTVESRIDATVSLVPGVSEAVTSEITTYLSSMSQVVSVNLISADQALQSFKQTHANDPQILRSLDEVGENPFGPVVVVQARAPEDYQFIFEALENPTYSEFIQNKNFTNHRLLVDRITEVTNKVRSFGIILATIFAAIAVLIIFNTVRVAIYTYREEIGIMKLVGASNWFVRGPFLLESIIYSLFSVLITVAIIFPIVILTEPQLVRFFDGTNIGLLAFFRTQAFVIFGLEFVGLVVLNILSSLFAVGRYLKS